MDTLRQKKIPRKVWVGITAFLREAISATAVGERTPWVDRNTFAEPVIIRSKISKFENAKVFG